MIIETAFLAIVESLEGTSAFVNQTGTAGQVAGQVFTIAFTACL